MTTDKNKKRTDPFKINDNLEKLIKELSHYLSPVQKKIQEKFCENKYPFIFIVGCPRSGTTLLLQWLASLGVFSYPTNVLNRFAYAPYIGAQIQKLLFDPKYGFSNELIDIQTQVSFESNLGKSKGALNVSEFQHFFRNYINCMNNFEPRFLTKNEIDKVDFKGIKKGLISIELAFGKPFVVKLMMFLYNLTSFLKHIHKSIFIYIKREPLYNMQSLLLAREKYYGDRSIWWSVKPKEYDILKDMDIFHQIAGQVYYTNQAIETALNEFPEENKLIIKYEEFCKNPGIYYQKLRDKYKLAGYELPQMYEGVESFEVLNQMKIFKDEFKKFEKAYRNFISISEKINYIDAQNINSPM